MLESLALDAMPKELTSLGTLSILSLSINDIAVLDVSILKTLTCLKELSIARNKVEELPAEIGRLTNLSEVVLSGNLIPISTRNLQLTHSLQFLKAAVAHYFYLMIIAVHHCLKRMDCRYMHAMPLVFSSTRYMTNKV